jgi:outer membrane protein W
MAPVISWTFGSAGPRVRPGRTLPFLLGGLLLSGTGVSASVPRADVGDDREAVTVAPSEEEPAAETGPYALTGRSRFEMRLGFADLSVHDSPWTDTVDVSGGAFSLVFLHWMSEAFAFELSLGATNVGVTSRQTPSGDIVKADGFGGFLAGGRFYLPVRGAFRPHVGVAVGPMTEYRVHDRPWHTDVDLSTTILGVSVEAGADFLVGRHFVIGVYGGTTARHGYGPERSFGLNLGWAFGGR